MKYLRSILVIVFPTSLFFACNNPTNKAKENNATQTTSANGSDKTDSVMAMQNTNNDNSVNTANSSDTSLPIQGGGNPDSMLSQLKNLTSMFGKGDSGILKNLSGGSGTDSMMQKLQSMMGGKNGNPGDAMANKILNFQLGQMKDDNPLKAVSKGMLEAQKNGTAGPDKAYTTVYTEEQPASYSIPVSGNGNTIMLQYTGGSITNGKKDGLWKNIYVSSNASNKWHVYTEAYAELSALNIKAHTTTLADINENYSILMNDQYKKYNKEPRSELGKNESAVQVQKIGNEKLFGYNCVHVRITYTLKALGQTEIQQDDEWYSADVPGAQFLSPAIFENHSPAVVKKIIDAGCKGVLVKYVSASKDASQLFQLSGITRKDMPVSLFSLPSNYQEDKNAGMYGMF